MLLALTVLSFHISLSNIFFLATMILVTIQCYSKYYNCFGNPYLFKPSLLQSSTEHKSKVGLHHYYFYCIDK